MAEDVSRLTKRKKVTVPRKRKSKKNQNQNSQPLSKRQELNNHVVCMRNTVQQARVQLINRLIHQIKRYRSRKGDKGDQEKAVRKADRLLEEIQTIKKLKRDKISLYALQVTRELSEVFNDPGSSIEERALVRFSYHPLVQKDAQKYRKENPNWDKQIPVLLGMTKRRKKNNSEETNGNTSSTATKATLKTDQKDKGISSDSDDGNAVESNSVKRLKLDTRNRELETAPSSLNPSGKQKPIPKEVISKPRIIDKTEGTVKVKFLTDLRSLEEDGHQDSPPNTKRRITVTGELSGVKKPKSSFFVGGIDEPEPYGQDELYQKGRQENYQKPSQKHDFNSESKPVYKKGKLVTKPQQQRHKQVPPNQSHHSRGKGNFRQDKPSRNFGFGANSEPLGGRKSKQDYPVYQQGISKSGPGPSDEKLHPSWEAKKKQQQISLTAFQGKKIVFDED